MALQSKRKKIVVSVTASTLIVGLVCIFILAKAISGDTSPRTSGPQSSNTASQSTAAETATPSVTPTPTKTTPPIYKNSPYDINYSTSKKPQTPSVTTPTPTVTTPPPYEDAKLEVSNIELKQFNAQTAKYEITLQFNQSGKVKIVAANSEQGLTTNDITAEYIRTNIFKNNDYNLVSLQQSTSIAGKDVNANEPYTFEITTSASKFDLFIILDGNGENEYMKIPISITGQGGVPVVDNDNSRVEVNSDTNQIICHISTTFDAEVTIKIMPSRVSLNSQPFIDKKNTTNRIAEFTVNNASRYIECTIKVTIKYKNITGSGEWILIDSLEINNDND